MEGGGEGDGNFWRKQEDKEEKVQETFFGENRKINQESVEVEEKRR